MGLLKKIKKVAKITSGVGMANKARKKGNKMTKSALGAGGGKHKKAGTRSGGKRAAARNARAAAPTAMKRAAKTVGAAAGRKRAIKKKTVRKMAGHVANTRNTRARATGLQRKKTAVRKAPTRAGGSMSRRPGTTRRK